MNSNFTRKSFSPEYMSVDGRVQFLSSVSLKYGNLFLKRALRFFGVIALCCTWSFGSMAQVFEENFSDGNFSDNPTWYGDTDHFIVNADFELQLNAPFAGQSYLMVPVQTGDEVTWEFYFRLEFPPSGTNRLRVYLQSDQPNLNGALNGYFLEVGESGNDDAIELRRQTGTSTALVLRGANGEVAFEPAEASVRVVRTAGGNWELWADYSGGNNLMLDASGSDNTHSGGKYFGFQCNYTATRTQHFFFDHIKIEPVIPDTVPPSVTNVVAWSENTVQIVFDEPIDQLAASQPELYVIDQGISVTAVEAEQSSVTLTSTALTSAITYNLTILSVTDLAGNTAENLEVQFVYHMTEQPVAGDLIITEIMADPNPPVGLPNAEYIELYNASQKFLNLQGINFSDGGTGANLPFHILHPGQFVIVTRVNDAPLFESFGTVLGVTGFPNLVNAGDDLYLKSSTGVMLHEVFYRSSWYNDPAKAGGGWALEMINPQAYCLQAENWTASNAFAGGTPGAVNSVWNDVPDNQNLTVALAEAFGHDEVYVRFSRIPSIMAMDPGSYTISGFQGDVLAVSQADGPQSVILKLSAPYLVSGNSYSLSVAPVVLDCLGNPAAGSFQFMYTATVPAAPYDIVISEIMANPNPPVGLPNSKYVELYNRSDNAVNLRDFALLDRTRTATLPNYVLLPGEYVLFHGTQPSFFAGLDNARYIQGFIEPRISGDDIELLDPDGNIIHAVYYTSSWYRNSSKANGGWSLEMVNYNDACIGAENWTASNDLSGGTPGRVNSVADTSTEPEALRPLRAYPINAQQVRIDFNRSLNRALLLENNPFSIAGITVTIASVQAPLFRQVVLQLDQPMEQSIVYTIQVEAEIEDCIGHSAGAVHTVRVGLPSKPEPGDLVINELLYDPETGGSRFIEFYNRSARIIDMNGLVIADRDGSGNIDRAQSITADMLSFPGDFVTITPDAVYITDRYQPLNPQWLIQNSMPALDRRSGTVLIYFPDIFAPLVLDEFAYSNGLHSGLLSNRSGVSLERLDPERETNDPANWHSAASAELYGTPTYQNSQYFPGGQLPAEVEFFLLSDRISPDGDGFEDVLVIQYELDMPGFIATLDVYDAQGRRIRQLANQELLGREGFFQWDGTTDSGTKAALGIHVLHVQYFHPDGITKARKIPFVVAARL